MITSAYSATCSRISPNANFLSFPSQTIGQSCILPGVCCPFHIRFQSKRMWYYFALIWMEMIESQIAALELYRRLRYPLVTPNGHWSLKHYTHLYVYYSLIFGFLFILFYFISIQMTRNTTQSGKFPIFFFTYIVDVAFIHFEGFIFHLCTSDISNRLFSMQFCLAVTEYYREETAHRFQ